MFAGKPMATGLRGIILKQDSEIWLVSLSQYSVTLSVCCAHTLKGGEFLDQHSKHQLLNVSSYTIKKGEDGANAMFIHVQCMNIQTGIRDVTHDSLFLQLSPYWGLWPDSWLCVDMTHRLGTAFSIRVCVWGGGALLPTVRVLSLLPARSGYLLYLAWAGDFNENDINGKHSGKRERTHQALIPKYMT